MIEGKMVRLRGLELTDLEKMWRFFNNADLQQFFRMLLPASKEEEEQFLRNTWEKRQKRSDFIFAIETLEKNEYIGNVGLHSIDWINRSTILGIVILDSTFWGQGYGSDTLKVIIEYSFQILNLNRIELEVYKSNERALRVYKKVGFQKIGERRQKHYFKGEYENTILMDLLKEEWSQK